MSFFHSDHECDGQDPLIMCVHPLCRKRIQFCFECHEKHNDEHGKYHKFYREFIREKQLRNQKESKNGMSKNEHKELEKTKEEIKASRETFDLAIKVYLAK